MAENRYAKIIDDKTKEVQVGVGCTDEYYIEIGMTLMDVEQAYNSRWYVAGYAPAQPEPTEDEKKVSVRACRDYYLNITDYTQLLDSPYSAEEIKQYAAYRTYLRDYTNQENWWEQNPMTFDEWKKK
ncbi:MAG: hypothetical protein IKA10_04605 [Oscillospiraceae bacterium]|nr:hypothetical protein [Oscillospiraceae bacterium]